MNRVQDVCSRSPFTLRHFTSMLSFHPLFATIHRHVCMLPPTSNVIHTPHQNQCIEHPQSDHPQNGRDLQLTHRRRIRVRTRSIALPEFTTRASNEDLRILRHSEHLLCSTHTELLRFQFRRLSIQDSFPLDVQAGRLRGNLQTPSEIYSFTWHKTSTWEQTATKLTPVIYQDRQSRLNYYFGNLDFGRKVLSFT